MLNLSVQKRSPLFQSGLALAVALLALDYATKWLVREWLMVTPRVIPVTDFFNLVLIGNKGVSFGILGAAGLSPVLLSLLSVVTALALGVWLYHASNRMLASALALLIGGALGNGLDRLRYGAVTDFLDFHIAGWHWPAFNVADICVFGGVGLLLLDSFYGDAHKKSRIHTDAA